MTKLLLATMVAAIISPAAFAAHGIDHDVTVKVNGLVCDFCAQALEKVFGKRDEVNAITVDLDNSEVIIDMVEGQKISDEELTALITDSGYNVSDIIHSAHE